MRCSVVAICISVIFLSGGNFSFTAAEAEVLASRNYVVQYGDTLWDIASDQLNNPFRWREIHQNNPHIINPNLIYPGDILGVTPGKSGTIGRKKLSDKAIARPWYGVPAPKAEEVKRPKFPNPIVPSTDFIEANGYIVPYTMKQLES